MSNWTAAALIAGTGATTLALAHHAFPIGSRQGERSQNRRSARPAERSAAIAHERRTS